jgi:hypothetical protein
MSERTGIHIPDKTDVALLEEENNRLRGALQKVILWLERLAKQSDSQEQSNRGRFDSLADANAADAKNYRTTADSLRKALTPGEPTDLISRQG